MVHVRLRRIEVLQALAVLVVAVRVGTKLPVGTAPPRLAVVDQALDAHPARERHRVAGLVGRQQQPDQRERVRLARGMPVDRASLGVQARRVLAPHLAAVDAPADAARVVLEPGQQSKRPGRVLARAVGGLVVAHRIGHPAREKLVRGVALEARKRDGCGRREERSGTH